MHTCVRDVAHTQIERERIPEIAAYLVCSCEMIWRDVLLRAAARPKRKTEKRAEIR